MRPRRERRLGGLAIVDFSSSYLSVRDRQLAIDAARYRVQRQELRSRHGRDSSLSSLADCYVVDVPKATHLQRGPLAFSL